MLVCDDYLALVLQVHALVVIPLPASQVHWQTAPLQKPKYDTNIT